MGSSSQAINRRSTRAISIVRSSTRLQDCSTRLPVMMEAFFQLLPLLLIPYHGQARPGAWVWGQVGDEPKAAAFRRPFPAAPASTAVVELTSDSSQVAVTLE